MLARIVERLRQNARDRHEDWQAINPDAHPVKYREARSVRNESVTCADLTRDFGAPLAASLDAREHALVEALRELEMRAREVMPTSDDGVMDFHKLGSALSAARAALALYDGGETGGGDASG